MHTSDSLCLSFKVCQHISVVFILFQNYRNWQPRLKYTFLSWCTIMPKVIITPKWALIPLKKNHLFHGIKAEKANMLERSLPNSVPGPPFRLFRATNSVREDFSLFVISLSLCQTSTVASSESSSPSSPPWRLHSHQMSQIKWKHAFPRLDLKTECKSTILHQETDPQSLLDSIKETEKKVS